MQYLTLLALPLLSAAAPTLNIRAGAPSKAPLPASCAITHAWPSANSTAFAPTSSFISSNEIYSYSLSPGSTTPDGTDDAQSVKDCLEACYGYGNPGECKSVWTGHGVSYEEYGTTLKAEFVCRIFGANITAADLGPQTAGDADSQAKALMVGCERSGW